MEWKHSYLQRLIYKVIVQPSAEQEGIESLQISTKLLTNGGFILLADVENSKMYFSH